MTTPAFPSCSASERKVFFREAINRALREEMQRDRSVFLMGQDIGPFGGPYKDTVGLHAEFGAARVRDTPVAEASMVGLAVGAAAAGMRPVTFITYMDFLMLGMDPLVNYGAKLRYKTAGQLSAPLVIKTTAGAKGQGVAHSQCLEAWLMSVPGLRVVAPSNARDAYGLMKSAIRDDGPVVFMDHKRLFPLAGTVPEDEELVPLGSAAIVRMGGDATIVTHSYQCHVALEAARRLELAGIGCTVVDLRSLAPLDMDTVTSATAATGHLLLLEEGQSTCGVGAEIAFRVGERLSGIRVDRLGARRMPISSSEELEAFALPDPERVVAAVRRLLAPRTVEGRREDDELSQAGRAHCG
jgi:pyruvate/2-oxoglutarate/acetoin dehydrogenase E1 component